MKTVIIPNDYHPFVIEVNGVKYTYPEGTEQSVPDEVASAIENIYKLQPREGAVEGVPFAVSVDEGGEKEYFSKYSGKEIDDAIGKADAIPAVTSADSGKVLGVNESGEIVPVTGGGGGLPDITVADYGKMLTVNDQGKLILKQVNYDIQLTSTDGTTWESDMTFETLSSLITASPKLPLRFNFELWYRPEGDSELLLGDVYNATGVLVSKNGSDPFVQFTLDDLRYIVISNDYVSVFFD